MVSSLQAFSSILQICFKFCSGFFKCIVLKQKQVPDKYRKIYRKISEKPFRLETTILANFVVPIHDLLLLHFSSLKQILENTKYRKLIGNIPEKNPQARHHPSGSDLLFCLSSIPNGTFFTRIEHTVQQWDASNLHECKQ